ncbi:MAG: class I SAM-dependent methyltransferase [Spirochaetales bacterium]|nr:class I SAM-dependent methyltransferase [Spirochaetales bacterium]
MVDLLPTIRRLFPSNDIELKVLDVGPRTGAGSALLAQLHDPRSRGKLKMRVTAMDINPRYAKYARYRFPQIDYKVGNIFDTKETYDLVICSHVIEHMNSALQFVNRLVELARSFVVVACPWKEPPERFGTGHIWSVTEEFIDNFDIVDKTVYEGVFYKRGSELIIFAIPGSAE